VLLGEGMKGGKRGGLGQRLAVELDKGQRPRGEVLRAIVGVANLLPHLRSSFVGTFVHGLVNRLLLHLNPANAEAAMAVLKHLIVASPENISSLVRYDHTHSRSLSPFTFSPRSGPLAAAFPLPPQFSHSRPDFAPRRWLNGWVVAGKWIWGGRRAAESRRRGSICDSWATTSVRASRCGSTRDNDDRSACAHA
jgi:hypothetical protein